MSGLFNAGFHTLETALAAREQLQLTHAANIANVDTPNYHADTRTFADFFQMERSREINSGTQSEPGEPTGHSILGNRQHMHGGRQQLDGNTVDIQKEMAQMAENQLMHEMTIRLIKGKLSGLANAIKEAGR